MADATTDRAPVRMLFITDEEWQALTIMVDRGIDNAVEIINEIGADPVPTEDELEQAISLRALVSNAQRAIESIGRREVARG